ncbi:MAG TPA: DUF3667 domain-containing protein [Burkholderiaceae bacterium]|jgi:hypothetical protein
MSDIDIPGDVLAGAVVAHAVGKSLKGGEHDHHHATACANCGAELSGRFCHQCGQSSHVHRSLLHMFEELLHGIFHFETKAWRTLPLLLFRPGRLTREYIEGKRVRYVGPLPLFLFMMFVMFMVFSFTGSKEGKEGKLEHAKVINLGAKGEAQAKDAAAELKRLKAELATLPADDARRAGDEKQIKALESKLAALTWVPSLAKDDDEDAGKGAGKDAGKDASKDGIDVDVDATFDAGTLTQEKLHQQLQENIPWAAQPTLERKIVHAFHNKELAFYKIKSGAAKFAILLVPITLPFLWLLFVLRRQYKMFDHAVFSFYSLSAMAVWMTLSTLLVAMGFKGTGFFVYFLAPPVHLFVQLRGAYVLSNWGALWRTVALSIYALLALTAYFLIVVLVSM